MIINYYSEYLSFLPVYFFEKKRTISMWVNCMTINMDKVLKKM